MASATVIVDAKNDAARRFYERHELLALPDTPARMFVPMRTIAALFTKDDVP